jgi:hypothetical protein
MSSSGSAPRQGRWVYAPLGVVIVLALLWSAGWLYATSRAEGVINAWIEREARDGRNYLCEDRSIGGFPFRIEVRCRGVTAQLRDPGGVVVLKTQQLTAVAQVYRPDLIIAEVSGPMTIALPGADDELVVQWRLLQASLRGRPRDLRRLSIVADAPEVRAAGAANDRPLAQAARFEAHVRRNEQSPADKPVFDLAARTSNATVALAPGLADRAFNAEAIAVLRGMHDFSPRPFKARLRDWQAQGGRLEIVNVRLEQGDSLATAKGEVGLSGQGRLDGRVNLLLAGLEHLIGPLLGNENASRSRAGILSGLSLLGRAELEGKRAVAVPLILRDGRVYLGPVPVGNTAPLF